MKYRTLTGINWTPPDTKKETRAEAGTVIEDKQFSKSSVAAFLQMGAIEQIKESDSKPAKPTKDGD